MNVDRVVAGMELPRSNGELVFAAPWESRAFGLAVAMHREGSYGWREFSEGLAAVSAEWEPLDEDGSRYYERWLAALERLLLERGFVSEADIAARAAEIQRHDDHHGDHAHH